MSEPQQFISESCSWFHVQGNYAQALVMQSFSGVGLNQLGLFRQCLQDESLRYFLMKYTLNQTENAYYTGICYSKNCTASDLDYIAKSVNEYITLPFNNYRIYQPHLPQEVWNYYTIVYTIITCIILIPVVLSTIYYLIKKQELKKKQNRIIQIFSLQSSFIYLLNNAGNNQRSKVVVGVRAFAFLGMTLFNLMFALVKIPSLPEVPKAERYFVSFYFFFDIWLMINGFYLALELSKQWNKQKSIKFVFQTFLRKTLKIIIISTIVVIWINYLVHVARSGPLWALTFQYFQNQCDVPVIGKCNYGLWIWTTEVIMCCLACLLFLLYHGKGKYCFMLYVGINIILFLTSVLVAFFFGQNQRYGRLQGGISNCSIVISISYLLGFNLGILYFVFRINKQKPKLLIMRILKYQYFRILITIISLSICGFVYLYFIFLQDGVCDKLNQVIYQMFHVILPLGYALLVVPEMMGFGNVVGAFFRDRFLNVISKLSFSSYSIYYLVSLLISNSRKQDLYINSAKILCLWACSIAMSLLYGLIFCVVVQLPVHKLLLRWIGKNNLRAFIQFD